LGAVSSSHAEGFSAKANSRSAISRRDARDEGLRVDDAMVADFVARIQDRRAGVDEDIEFIRA
jgi:hypothetical protein